jgi:hypothetical protein
VHKRKGDSIRLKTWPRAQQPRPRPPALASERGTCAERALTSLGSAIDLSLERGGKWPVAELSWSRFVAGYVSYRRRLRGNSLLC